MLAISFFGFLIISLFGLIFLAQAQTFNPGLPLPGLPKSLGQKTMANSTSVTLASNQTALTVTANGKTPVSLLRRDYSTNNVTITGYAELVASTANVTNALEIFDSSGQTMIIAFGAAGSEVNKFYDYPGGNGRMEVLIPLGTRISITTTGTAATSGELDINFYE